MGTLHFKNTFLLMTYNYWLSVADYSKADVSLSHGISPVDIRCLSRSVTGNKNDNLIYYLGFLLKENVLDEANSIY